MIKVKNLKRFRIFLIVSVILLIVLVWCIVWINVANSENKTESGGRTINEKPISAGQTTDKIKTEDQEKAKENSSEQLGKKENEADKMGDASSSLGNSSKAPKPIVEPENLPENEVYATYNNTLIIGDSRTEGFKLYSGVKNASYFCMKAMTIDKIVEGKQVTIDGQSVSVYDLLDAKTYDKVIVGVGLNELGWNHIETFIEDYAQLIDKIKEKQPNATIYLQAVLPVSKSKNDNDKVHNNAQIYWYNENIIKLASDKGVQFVNPAAALVDSDGYLVAEATTDGVHLNSDYCKVWAKYLAELV